MRDLFHAEWLRLRRWAAGLALAHLGWLIFLDRLVDPLRQPLLVYQVYLALLALLGLAFGVYHLSFHARQAAWIDLLHRPLAPGRIGAALLLAGLALAGLALALPVALLLAFHQGLGAHDVELRHLLFPVAAWAVGATGYALGVHLRLGPPRLAWSATLLLVWLYQSRAHGPAAVAVQLAALAIAGLLAWADFRPDRRAAGGRVRPLVQIGLASLALGVGGVAGLRFLIQLGLMLAGSHPLNGVPPAGGLVEAVRADGAALFALGLDARDPRQRFWIEQAALSEIVTLEPQWRAACPRYSLSSPADNAIEDRRHHLVWNFSHDRMRYAAIDLQDRRPWTPATPPPRLPAPPLADGAGEGGLIVAGHRVLQYDAASQTFADRLTLPEGERLLAPPAPAWDRLAVLSDRALRLYDGRVLRLGDRRLPALARLPLPRPAAGLVRVDLLELLDGYLVGLTYGAGVIDGRGRAEQQFWRVDADGARLVARRTLGADYPAVLRAARFWFAPALSAMAAWASGMPVAPDAGDPPGPWQAAAQPPAILALAFASHALAAALGAWRARRLGLAARVAMPWALAGLLLGLPLLAAFWLSRRPRQPC